jgi:hypothetical protein
MESLRYTGYKTHLTADEHKLVLNPDGRCQAETFLEPAHPSAGGNGTWLTASVPCRWQLGTDGRHQTLALTFSMASTEDRRLAFYFDEEAGSLILWQYASDPDAWKYMEF